MVSEQGVATEPEKVQAIVTWPRPTDVTAVRAFLGTVSYYRQYIPRFAEIARPLHRLTQKGTPWSWPMEAETAFQTLRRCLVTAPILAYPDPAKRFVVDTDASKESLGAVLSQLDEDGSERVIAYYSKSMTQPERNYCVTRKELLAVVRAVGHFRPYLYGQNFLLRTDHAALVWLMKTSTPEGQVAQWLSMLGEFCFEMKHRPGRLHSNADGLSRRPCPSECRQCSRFGPDMEERPLEVTHLAPVRVDGEQLPRLTDESSPGQLARTQACDAGYVTIVYDAVLRSRELPQDLLQRSGAELATLARLVPSMFIDEQDVLRVRLGDRRTPALCPPRWREELVWLVHRQAHAGAAAVVRRLRLSWFWPGMVRHVRRQLRTCETCQAAKHGGKTARSGRGRLYAGRPWQVVAVDLVGPMPETERGNRWILVVADHFTRWADALPIEDSTAATVAKVLDERVF